MTPSDLVDYVEFKLGITQTTDFADMLLITNQRKNEICSRINEVNPGFFGNYGHDDLQADKREYDLPKDKMGTLKAVFLKLDGTNYVRAKWLEFNDPIFAEMAVQDPLNLIDRIQKAVVYQEGWITDRFTNDNPYVFTYRDSLFILSGTITGVSDGVQLWYSTFPDDIPDLTESSVDLSTATDSSATVAQGLPKQFHELLARGTIIDYKESKDLPLAGREPYYEQDIEKTLNTIRDPNLDEPIIGVAPYNTGHDY